MAQAYFSLVTNIGKIKLAQSAAGGAPVVITHFAIGDGNGAETNPTAASAALVREVWRTPVESVVTDPENPSAILVTAIIPTNASGWWMREFGVFDAAGAMIAVAKPVSQYKPTALEGQLEDIRYEFQIVIGETANVTLLVDPSLLFATRSWVENRKIPMAQLMRLPWLPVISLSMTAPPAAPKQGDAYLIPAGATGAWAAHVGKIAEWAGSAWSYTTPPDGHGTSLPDGRVFIRLAGTYAEMLASEAFAGLTKLATAEEAVSAVGDDAVPARHLSYYLRQPSSEQVFWVRPDGSDANDGGANTSAHAFLTVNGAINHIRDRYGASGRRVVLQLGTPGTYASFQIANVPTGVLLRGDRNNRAGYVFGGGNTITAANVSLEGIVIHPAGAAASHNLQVYGGAAVVLDCIRLGGANPLGSWAQLIISGGSNVTLSADPDALEISQGANIAILAQSNSAFRVQSGTGIKFIGSPTFGTAAVYAAAVSAIALNGGTITGTVTGKRYHAVSNAVIDTSGAGANFIPGTVAGTVASGGQYV